MPHAKLIAIAALLLAPLAFANSASAQLGGGEPKASVELVVPKTSVKPGETLDVGVKFTMKPGWHIYWTNPGDSGQPPTFSWNLPGGGASAMLRGSPWTATEPRFPVPERWTDAGGLVNFGYSKTVIFPATLTVPASATPGQSADVTLTTNYLICKDVCLPESATATATFEVGLDSGEGGNKSAASDVEKAKKRLATQASSPPKVGRNGEAITLTMAVPAGAKDVGFFPETPDGVSVEKIDVKTQGDKATVTFSARPLGNGSLPASMPATLGYTTPEGRRGVSVTVPLTQGN